MTSPTLHDLLLRWGRHQVGPIVEEYLGVLDDRGIIRSPDLGEAFELLYGLLIRDTQIRVLLGEPPPSRSAILDRANDAVDRFLSLGRSDEGADDGRRVLKNADSSQFAAAKPLVDRLPIGRAGRCSASC